ncbi:hypothetical protein DsansV1_C07g0070991 [Dioscorea sansibarensis]
MLLSSHKKVLHRDASWAVPARAWHEPGTVDPCQTRHGPDPWAVLGPGICGPRAGTARGPSRAEPARRKGQHSTAHLDRRCAGPNGPCRPANFF